MTRDTTTVKCAVRRFDPSRPVRLTGPNADALASVMHRLPGTPGADAARDLLLRSGWWGYVQPIDGGAGE